MFKVCELQGYSFLIIKIREDFVINIYFLRNCDVKFLLYLSLMFLVFLVLIYKILFEKIIVCKKNGVFWYFC